MVKPRKVDDVLDIAQVYERVQPHGAQLGWPRRGVGRWGVGEEAHDLVSLDNVSNGVIYE